MVNAEKSVTYTPSKGRRGPITCLSSHLRMYQDTFLTTRLLLSSELPNPTIDPKLYDNQTQMVHSLYGILLYNIKHRQSTARVASSIGMLNACRIENTPINEADTDGYPLYHRRKPADGGFIAILWIGRQDVEINNR